MAHTMSPVVVAIAELYYSKSSRNTNNSNTNNNNNCNKS